jgi:DNA-binding winged helix-turn-helix (wHTH) protein/tetratricopeptide (TPR) repeat protein
MSPVEPGHTERERLGKTAPSSEPSSDYRIRFGLYEVNLRTHELRKGGLRLKVPRQSFQILAMLLRRPGQIVPRDDLRRELWPDDVFVNFEGSLNSAVQRLRSVLQDTSREPRYIETLPREGYRFIGDIEAVAPAPPPSEALDVAVAFVAAETSVESEARGLRNIAQRPGRVRRRWAAATTALLLVILVASYAGHRYSGRLHRRGSEAQTQSSSVVRVSLPRRSVAIIGFTNVSGDAHSRWLSTAFTEMLATELGAGDQLRTIAQENVARAKLELSLRNEDSYAADTLTKIHKDLGCDYVVTGSYLPIGQATNGRLRLDARVQDAVTGDTVATVAVIGYRADLYDLAYRAGEQLRAKLGVGTLTSTEAKEAKLALPSDPEAARLYSDGLAKLRVYDDVAASDLLATVIRLQPDYSPAYSALATALSDLGYDSKAADAARKAMDLAQNLSPQARLQTEAHFHEINGDWIQAIEIYSRLQRSYPDNLEFGLDLAAAQISMGKSTEALATISALRTLPAPDRDDPRIDLTEARIDAELADYKRERALAESAARKSEMSGARLLLAQAKLNEGWALDSLGDFSGAMDAYGVAQRTFTEFGNFDASARVLLDIASVLVKQGDLAGSERGTEQALNVFRNQGDQAKLAAALSDLGELFQMHGELLKAESLLREGLAIFRKLNMKSREDIVTSDLADVLAHEGKFREAKDMLEPLMEPLRGAGNKSLLEAVTETLGAIAEAQGDMPTALRTYQEAVALFKDTGDKGGYAGDERLVGRALLREGDFVNAKRAVSEALSVDREIGAKTDAALAQVALAEVALAQAEPADMDELRSAIDELRTQKITADEIEAEVVLARVLMQQGKTSEAASTLKETSVLSAKSHDETIRFDVALATAHLRTTQRRFDEARRTVQAALQKAGTMGCVRCELEARLELGEIEIRAGNVKEGRAQLHHLAEEAGSRGFNQIAQQAAAQSSGASIVSRNFQK